MSVFEKIYDAVRKIPMGNVATYGQIAALVGNPRLARVVGYALHRLTRIEHITVWSQPFPIGFALIFEMRQHIGKFALCRMKKVC